MALHLKHHLKKPPSYLHHNLHLLLRHSSSFPPPSPPPENSDPPNPENPNPPNPQNPQNSNSDPSASLSSFFSSIKDSLKSSPPTPPRRIQTYPRPPIAPSPQSPRQDPPSPSPSPSSSFNEIQKHLASFRLRNQNQNQSQDPTTPSPSSTPTSVPFQDLFKQNVKLSHAGGNASCGWDRISFDSMRETLHHFSPPGQTSPDLARQEGQPSLKRLEIIGKGNSNTMQQSSLPVSIFGKEVSEKARRVDGIEEEGNLNRTEFVKQHSYEELEEKLRRLRPEVARQGEGKEGFLLSELNEKVRKLRAVDKEMQFEMSSKGSFNDLRDALSKLNKVDEVKKYNSRNYLL